MSGQRARRVADQIRHDLADLVRELRDPRIGLVTITDVRISTDLRHARIFVMTIGEDSRQAVSGLNHAAPFLRRELARSSGLRFTPTLKFFVDEAAERGHRVDELLEAVRPEEEPESESGNDA